MLVQLKIHSTQIRITKRYPEVRLGSLCDINAALAEVRFAPYSARIARRQLTSA